MWPVNDIQTPPLQPRSLQKVIVGTIVFCGLFISQTLTHGIYNAQIVTLLPSDGCGQILDQDLFDRLSMALDIANGTSILFSLIFAIATQVRIPAPLVWISGVAAVAGFAGGALLIHQNHKHLVGCDLFFDNGNAIGTNILMIAVLFGAVLLYSVRRYIAKDSM